MQNSKSAALAIALLALVLSAPTAAAQAVPHQNVIQFSPFGVLADYYTAEYERTVAETFTLGISATHLRTDSGFDEGEEDTRWTSSDLKLRFYPNATPLRGFSFGITGGFLRYSDLEVQPDGSYRRATDSTPTFGMEGSHQWLLGVHDNFVVAVGIGAKRIISRLDVVDAPRNATGYFRLNIGYAF